MGYDIFLAVLYPNSYTSHPSTASKRLYAKNVLCNNDRMDTSILMSQQKLANHPVYQSLHSLTAIRTFMQYHVFAVWDFMSLLKSIQREVTCISVPWRESSYDPELVRLINEIVLAEESDMDESGHPCSHFSMYIDAMREIGASTELIESFVTDLNYSKLPKKLAPVVRFHLELACTGKAHEVMAAFFYGREKIIPAMFESIVSVLEKAGLACPSALYYFKRHIEVDGDQHGPMAQRCLDLVLKTAEQRREALAVAQLSLQKRNDLWNFIHEEIRLQKPDAYESRAAGSADHSLEI